ncbi:GntR family transcriptional regulator [Geomicrobium sp. JCM 19039]|uniref:GntR family transcriptional regulator n=1 Tax=Geomicrobium sp. JCM 19039 TaxID=1460636 RepID=UPI00045F4AD7|nr:GntR family transcriptional regulator [Geomicrobium sp. JCM 19039]GAK14702.1 transcriptional regulator, GntR family [Geomicrobium sp. JCM 19039]
MKAVFDDSKPIFLQIADMILEDILDGTLQEEEQIPSTTEISSFYQVNRATIQKGLAILVEAGYVYKQRGVGMFVATGANEKLHEQRKTEFDKMFIKPMIEEARRLELKKDDIWKLIMEGYDD